MPAKKQPASLPVYQLKVTLKGVKPPVWRRIQVRGDVSLGILHLVLQYAMGWSNYHLHAFTVGGVEYGAPDIGLDEEMSNEDRAKLNKLITAEKSKFIYEYDFGDNWTHEILVEKILTAEPGVAYPLCLAGARACPPEDCGGPWGYANLLEALADPSHEDHEEMTEWMEGPVDPEAFSLEDVNKQLKRLHKA